MPVSGQAALTTDRVAERVHSHHRIVSPAGFADPEATAAEVRPPKMTTMQKIAEIEADIARTQKNKATNKHLGMLKAKIAMLKREILNPKGGKSGPGMGFDVTKSGDTRIGLVGFPSVGKSTLLSKLTDTESEIAAYEFTTLTCIPGTFHYKGAKMQLLDLPGIIEGAKDGKGRGRQIIGTARSCDLLLIVLDATKPLYDKCKIEKELEGFGIRMNKEAPDIKYRPKADGGVSLLCTDNSVSLDECKAVLREYRVHNADIKVRYDGCTIDEIVDVVEGTAVYMPCIYVLNKIDSLTLQELDVLCKLPHVVPISSNLQWNFDELLETVWEYGKMMRIYTKPKGQIPDYEEPVILHAHNPTIEDFCNRLHGSIIDKLKYAWVWGQSVRHQPQKVGPKHVLMDEDIVQIVKKV